MTSDSLKPRLVSIAANGQVCAYSKIEGQRAVIIPVDENTHTTIWRKCCCFIEAMLKNGAMPAKLAVAALQVAGFSKHIRPDGLRCSANKNTERQAHDNRTACL